MLELDRYDQIRLPELPRDLRDKLCYDGFPITVAEILPPELTGVG